MLAWLNLFCVFNLSSVVDPQSTFEGQDLRRRRGVGISWLGFIYSAYSIFRRWWTHNTDLRRRRGVGISWLGLIYSAYSIFRRWWAHNLPLKGRILH